MVGPIQNNGAPAPIDDLNSPLVGNSSNLLSGNSLTDSIFSSSNSIDPSLFSITNPTLVKPSLMEILRAVSNATITAKQQGFEREKSVRELVASLYPALADLFQGLINNAITFRGIARDTQAHLDSVNGQINTVNGSINNYNENIVSGYNSQINAVRSAAENYNEKLAAYLADPNDDTNGALIGAYNNYYSTVQNYNFQRNNINNQINQVIDDLNNYNGQIPDNNAIAAELNLRRAIYFLDIIPLQEAINSNLPTLPQLDPASQGTYAPVPDIPTASNISQVNTIDMPVPPPTEFQLLLDGLIIDLLLRSFSMDMVKGNSKNLDFSTYYLRATNLAAVSTPDALFANTTASGANHSAQGSNAQMGAIAASLDPVSASRIFGSSTQEGDLQNLRQVIDNPEALTRLLTLSFVRQQSALLQGIDIAKNANIDLQSNPESSRSLRQILSVANAADLVQLFQGKPASTAGDASINLLLAGSALAVLSSELGNPNVGASILALSGLTSTDLFNITSQSISNRELLNDPFAAGVVADNLAEKLAQLAGNPTLKEAILEALKNPDSLEQSLKDLGVSNARDLAKELDNAAFTSRVAFRDDVQNDLVSKGFSNDEASSLASKSAGVATTATSDPLIGGASIDGSLFSQVLADSIKRNSGVDRPSEIAANIAKGFRENLEEVSEATLRDSLTKELQNQGIKTEDSKKIAADISIPLNPLANSQSIVHEQLVQTLQGVYQPLLSKEDALDRATNMANALVGPANVNTLDTHNESHQTLASIIKKDVDTLKNSKETKAFDEVVELYRDFNKRAYDLVEINRLKNEPAHAIANTQSIMDAKAAPSGGPVKIGGTHPAIDVPV